MVTSTRTDWEVKKSQAAAIIPAPEGLPGKLIFTIPGSTYNNAYKITFKTEVDPAKLDKTNLGTTLQILCLWKTMVLLLRQKLMLRLLKKGSSEKRMARQPARISNIRSI